VAGDIGGEELGAMSEPPRQQDRQHHVGDCGDEVQAVGQPGEVLLDAPMATMPVAMTMAK
jgi:hypothetical protein